MSLPQTELLAAPAFQFPSGEVVTCWDGPSPGREIRPDREAEYRRAEALLAVGIAHIRDEPRNYAVARRCFHSAVCLFAWALGADRRLAFAWDRLGFAYQSLGNDDEAERCYLRSLAIQAESGQERTTWNEVTLLNLARIYSAAGRPALTQAVLSSCDAKARHVLPGIQSPDSPAPSPSPAPAPAPRRRPKRGYSERGLRIADVVAAFVQAERELGATWRLAGRGHCERVVLDARYSRVVRPAIRSWARISPHGAGSLRTLFPLELVKRAAEILGVGLWTIAKRGY